MYIKDDFSKIYTQPFLKPPMTPGKWCGKPRYTPITRLMMTCGGGMGGSKWCEYVERVDLNKLASGDERYLVLKTWDGNTVFLNKAYVVKAEQFTILSAVLDSKNPNFPTGKYEYNYLVQDGHKVALTSE